MTYTVVLSAASHADLRDIARFIARDNPTRAVSFVEELIEKIEALAEKPMRFPARDEWRPGLRSALHRSYHIVFHVVGDTVQVVRVLHGARDIENLLK